MNLVTGPATKYTTFTFGGSTTNQVLEGGASVLVHSMVFTITGPTNVFPGIFQADGTTKIFVPYISGSPNNQTWETIGPILADKGISISTSNITIYIFYSRVGA